MYPFSNDALKYLEKYTRQNISDEDYIVWRRTNW